MLNVLVTMCCAISGFYWLWKSANGAGDFQLTTLAMLCFFVAALYIEKLQKEKK
jgi:hypothetical protein